ncbi:hypothetical protein D4764_13G0011660 [Takifugu flavidus]|uniref:Uncharacterized protein n=1 Tax=Takifugu flavidus TaxID=433684 RepID=A0A5C6P9N7_9TELE|nr:hypothetical protein D4764_13G0011660 [Takifugu flavidus]
MSSILFLKIFPTLRSCKRKSLGKFRRWQIKQFALSGMRYSQLRGAPKGSLLGKFRRWLTHIKKKHPQETSAISDSVEVILNSLTFQFMDNRCSQLRSCKRKSFGEIQKMADEAVCALWNEVREWPSDRTMCKTACRRAW